MAACRECWEGGDLKKLILCHLQQQGAPGCALWTLQGFIEKFRGWAGEFQTELQADRDNRVTTLSRFPTSIVTREEAVGRAIEHANWAGMLVWYHHYGGSFALTPLGEEAVMAMHGWDAYIGKRLSPRLPPEEQERLFSAFERKNL